MYETESTYNDENSPGNVEKFDQRLLKKGIETLKTKIQKPSPFTLKRNHTLLKIKERLENVETEFDNAKDEIIRLNQKIEDYNLEISQKSEENVKLLEANQQLFGKLKFLIIFY